MSLIWHHTASIPITGARFNPTKGHEKIVNFAKNRSKRVSRKKNSKYEIINNIYFKIHGYKNILF